MYFLAGYTSASSNMADSREIMRDVVLFTLNGLLFVMTEGTIRFYILLTVLAHETIIS